MGRNFSERTEGQAHQAIPPAPRTAWWLAHLALLSLLFLPVLAWGKAEAATATEGSFPSELAAPLVRVMEATDENATGSCMQPQLDPDLLVLRRSKTVEGAFYEGECLERRGDLLGAVRAWTHAAEPVRYGLRRLTSESYSEGAAVRLQEVGPTIPRLQPWEYLPPGAVVRIHGWGRSSSCAQPEGCELPAGGRAMRLNPGRYSLVLYPPGHPAGLRLGAEFRLEAGASFSIPEGWLVAAYLSAGHCRALERHGSGRGAAAVADCYSRQGDVTRSARWWQGYLLWVEAQADRVVDEPRRVELEALRQAAQRSLRGLPSLRVDGVLPPAAQLQLKGDAATASAVSCATAPCRIQVGRDKALAFGDYTLSLQVSGRVVYEQKVAITAARPKQVLTLRSPVALKAAVGEETLRRRQSLLTIGYTGLGLAGILGFTALAAVESCGSRDCAWPWAVAADVMAVSSGAFLVFMWLDPPGSGGNTMRVSGGCRRDGCGLFYGRSF